MEFWPEFLGTSGGREFVAGGVGGMAGVLAGHPLDTLRIRLQQPPPPLSPGIVDAPSRPPSAARLLRGILRAEGPAALYRGMAAPLASVAFQVSAAAAAIRMMDSGFPPPGPIAFGKKQKRNATPKSMARRTHELAIGPRHSRVSFTGKRKDVLAKTSTLLACRG